MELGLTVSKVIGESRFYTEPVIKKSFELTLNRNDWSEQYDPGPDDNILLGRYRPALA
jgi:hypothetical protein